jgi:hypothetical protein
MKTFTKLFAATALLASASTATLAQVDAGGALDAAGSVSVDAGSTSVDAGASGNANANSNAGGNNSTSVNAGGSTDAGGSVNASGNGNANTNASSNGNANANANANASGNTDLNYGQIISDLRTSTTAAADIEALGDSIEVQVVTLSELQGNAGENASALDQAVSTESTLATELKAADALTTYPELHGSITAELGAEYTMDDVVAITSSADGQVTVIVDDSAE